MFRPANWGAVVIRKPRLLTEFYKEMFKTDDNDLDGLILSGHNWSDAWSSCTPQ